MPLDQKSIIFFEKVEKEIIFIVECHLKRFDFKQKSQQEKGFIICCNE